MKDHEKKLFNIGELARLAGVTVRTLQYYDKEGLLPSKASESGRRMYSRDDLIRLQQILFLKSLGFPLQEIKGNLLKHGPADAIRVFRQQREILCGQIQNLNETVRTIDAVIAEAGGGQEISMEKLMAILRLMKEGNPYTFVVRSLNEEQFRSISSRFDSQEKYELFMENARHVFADLGVLYEKGADPCGEEGQKLAQRWWKMVEEFTEGDPGILDILVSSGKNMENWPEEARAMREPIKDFLSKALNRYLGQRGIQLTEAKKND